MFEVVFTVCSIVVGAACRELEPVRLEEHVGLMGCAIATQVEGAKWVESHPNHYIARSTCQPTRMIAKVWFLLASPCNRSGVAGIDWSADFSPSKGWQWLRTA